MKQLLLLIILLPSIGLTQNKRDNLWQMEDFEMIFDSTGMKAYPRWSELDRMDRTVGSISDEEGKLIAYTDGCSVANRNHKLMPNGDSLNFNQNFYDFYLNCENGYPQRQNLMILPDPANQDNHFIIHRPVDLVIDSMAGTLDFVEDKLLYSYCLLYTSPSPRDATLSRMPSSA